MLTRIANKVEFIANVAIVVVAVLLLTVLIKGYLQTRATGPPGAIARDAIARQPAKESVITPRSKLPTKSISALKLGSSNQTLILALSNNCHFCSESAPFYKRLAQLKRGTRFVAVMPQSIEDGTNYLKTLGVSVDEVQQTSFDQLGVQGTPTLLLVDSLGIVKSSWVGKLAPSREAEVLASVR